MRTDVRDIETELINTCTYVTNLSFTWTATGQRVLEVCDYDILFLNNSTLLIQLFFQLGYLSCIKGSFGHKIIDKATLIGQPCFHPGDDVILH